MANAALLPEQETGPGQQDRLLGSRVPHLDTAGAEAYTAVDASDRIALVQKPNIPFRAHVLKKLGSIRPCALSLVHEQRSQVVDGRGRVVFIVPRPSGPSLSVVTEGKGLPERLIRDELLPQLLATLRAIHEAGFTHRGLNPDRIFCSGSDLGSLEVAECVTAPPGMDQAVAYEPIERAMAIPSGRGEGGPADDYYALGATLLRAFLGSPLERDRSADELLANKIAHGSFTALAGGRQIAGGLANLFKGLLSDSPAHRWGAEEVAKWLEGATVPIGPGRSAFALAKPVTLGKWAYTDRRTVAGLLAENEEKSAPFIRGLRLDEWITQHLPNTPNSPELAKLILTGRSGDRSPATGGGAAQLVARMIALIDPSGPIRFRGQTVMPDGLNTAFALSQLGGDGDKEAFDELIDSGLLATLAEIMTTVEREGRRERMMTVVRMLSALQRIRNLPDTQARLLYELNPGLACMSPVLTDSAVTDIRSLLHALDSHAERAPERLTVIEPHITGFLAAHDDMAADKLSSRSPYQMTPVRAAFHMVKVLGELQTKNGVGPLKGLANFLARRIAPGFREFHSKTRREKLEQHLMNLADKGDLRAIAEKLDYEKIAHNDKVGFARARRNVFAFEKRLAQLENELTARSPEAVILGGRAAALLATIVLCATIVVRIV